MKWRRCLVLDGLSSNAMLTRRLTRPGSKGEGWRVERQLSTISEEVDVGCCLDGYWSLASGSQVRGLCRCLISWRSKAAGQCWTTAQLTCIPLLKRPPIPPIPSAPRQSSHCAAAALGIQATPGRGRKGELEQGLVAPVHVGDSDSCVLRPWSLRAVRNTR